MSKSIGLGSGKLVRRPGKIMSEFKYLELFRRINLCKKDGNEFVEASIVLPIIILLIISVMALTSFVFSGLCNRCNLHHNLLFDNQIDSRNSDYKINKKKEKTSSAIKGLVNEMYSKEFEDTSFSVPEAKIIRLKDIVHE